MTTMTVITTTTTNATTPSTTPSRRRSGLLVAVSLLTTTASAKDANGMEWKRWDEYQISTDRGPRFFNPPPPRKVGYAYNDDFRIDVAATLDSGMGMSMKGTFDFDVDVESRLSQGAAGPGSMSAEITMENIVMNLNAMMFEMHCDTNDPENSDHPDCDDLLAMNGMKEIVETDTNGDVTQITTFDGQTFTAEELGLNLPASESPPAPPAVGDNNLDSKFQAQQFAASMHFDKHDEIVKLLPDHAVNPGDSWIDNVDMNGMGVFKGVSYLKGYTNYVKDSADCALFYFEGSLHLDLTAIAEMLGPEAMEDGDLPRSMSDAKITAAILWDVNDELPRFAQANITTTLEVDNPMAGDGSTVRVPLDITLRMASDIIERPLPSDTIESPASTTTTSTTVTTTTSTPLSAVPVSEAKSSSSSDGKKRGAGGTFVLVMLLVGSVGGGYYVYEKRRQEQRIRQYYRPANTAVAQYEFSSLGSESMA